ncbi:MAG: Fic family protein [Pseudonocardia sp.]|nr:Fic family protein [Pseudonocardia sp.]
MAEFVDPYLDPETGILRNLVGARTQQELAAAEGALVFARVVEMADHPPRPTGDLAELRAIHHALFQDLFDWAGQLRTVDIRKSVEGAQYFLPVSMIDRAASFAFGQLAEERTLRGMSRDQFIERFAHHYDQVNYIHPFREGNGRTQRVFWGRIAGAAGWQLDWRKVDGSVNDHACRVAAEQSDFGPMHEMLDQIVAPIPHRSTEASAAARVARQSLPRPVADDMKNPAPSPPRRRSGNGPAKDQDYGRGD